MLHRFKTRTHPLDALRGRALSTLRAAAPTLLLLTLSAAAHAQGTMDFSGAQTLMGTFKTFAIYAGAVIRAGNLATIEHIHEDGSISVKTDSGANLQLTPEQAQHVEYGHAIESTKHLAVDRVILSGEAERITAQREALSQLPTKLHELTVYTSDGYKPAAPKIAVLKEFAAPAAAEISKLEIEVPSIEFEGYAIEM